MREPRQIAVVRGRIDHDEVMGMLDGRDGLAEVGELGGLVLVHPGAFGVRNGEMRWQLEIELAPAGPGAPVLDVVSSLSRRALGAAEQTKQKRAIGGIDGLQPVFYRLTAAPIEHEREMASHGARAGLLIEPIEHINVVLMPAPSLPPHALQPPTPA